MVSKPLDVPFATTNLVYIKCGMRQIGAMVIPLYMEHPQLVGGLPFQRIRQV